MTTRRKVRSRGGFTLIEVLITLIMIAGLIAFLFPVLTQQLGAADNPRLANDLSTIKTATQIFNANTRVFPGDIEDLIHEPSSTASAGDRSLQGGGTSAGSGTDFYTTSEVARWRGPYFDASMTTDDGNTTAGESDATQAIDGNVGTIESLLVCVPGAPGVTPTPATCAEDTHWVAIEISGITQTEFDELNPDFDPGESVNEETTGKFRWRTGDLAYLLVAPYQD